MIPTRTDLEVSTRSSFYLILDVPASNLAHAMLTGRLAEQGWQLQDLGEYEQSNTIMEAVFEFPVEMGLEDFLHDLEQRVLGVYTDLGLEPNPENWGVGAHHHRVYVGIVHRANIYLEEPVAEYLDDWGDVYQWIEDVPDGHSYYVLKIQGRPSALSPDMISRQIHEWLELVLRRLGYTTGTLETRVSYWPNQLGMPPEFEEKIYNELDPLYANEDEGPTPENLVVG